MAYEAEVQEEKKGGGKKRFFLVAMIAGLIAGLMFWRKRPCDDFVVDEIVRPDSIENPTGADDQLIVRFERAPRQRHFGHPEFIFHGILFDEIIFGRAV